MSTYEAIAAVSRTLKKLLEDRMENPLGPGLTVTLAPPDVKPAGASSYWLNLYLYQVTENGSLKNQDVPRPPLCLNLHYLLTVYAGTETDDHADITAQQILGDAMLVLHDFVIITPKLHEKDDPNLAGILDPVLTGATEQIKITLHPASLDELSKIWTSLPQSRFRRSVAYEVSVVELDSRRPVQPVQPVQARNIQTSLLSERKP
jgi:hypothetical protein